MDKLLVGVVAAVLMIALPACNTVQGIGKDIKKGGEAIEKVGH